MTVVGRILAHGLGSIPDHVKRASRGRATGSFGNGHGGPVSAPVWTPGCLPVLERGVVVYIAEFLKPLVGSNKKVPQYNINIQNSNFQ